MEKYPSPDLRSKTGRYNHTPIAYKKHLEFRHNFGDVQWPRKSTRSGSQQSQRLLRSPLS
jgi:hypothetical protein